ncbi:MAG: DEAD/DEAH box helicase [Nitrososphaera sp.]|jgi:ATP-dependent RNA helicase DeaD
MSQQGGPAEGQASGTFADLGLDERVLRALEDNGFDAPFPIQQAAIPLILQGKDVIGQAHTGTGKTAAYCLPILSRIRTDSRAMQVLILVPTRELALQVTGEIVKFSGHGRARAVAIYGGQGFGMQVERLRAGAQIVVATPGRLIDHMERGTVRLDNVRTAVLDEADRMLDMGFIDDIRFILGKMDRSGGNKRQTLLFSATMPQEILKLAKEHLRKDQTREIRLNRQEVTVSNIEQSYLVVSEHEKFNRLVTLIKPLGEQQQAIVFAATKDRTDRLARNLRNGGFAANAIHGDLQQRQRDSVMQRFRKGADSILVATDIAARGIDVPAVGYVINYDVPRDPETYFHRIGRTARAGGEGKAISLVTPDRFADFERIQKRTKLPISRMNEKMGIAMPAMMLSSSSRHQKRGQFFHGGRNRRVFKGRRR